MALLIGCQASYSPPPRTSITPPPPTAVRPPPPTSVKVEDSKFEDAATFIGIQEHPDRNTEYLLRSWVDKKSGQVTHQVYVANFYHGDWIFWSRANSEDAQPLQFVPIKQEVVTCDEFSRCSHSEHFAALIPDTVLRTHQDGFSVKFYGKTGKEMILRLTPQQIRQQLKVIEDFQAQRRVN